MARASWGINNASQYEAKFNAEIENTERKIYPIQVTCNKIYEALQREYGSILDERDWQYLDLVIFYYETGRAFTKQEALQQVDREVQTERIIDSIDRAAVYIGNTIRMGTYIISSQIEGLSRQLSNISLDIKELNVNVKSLISYDGTDMTRSISPRISAVVQQIDKISGDLTDILTRRIQGGEIAKDKITEILWRQGETC